MTLAEFGAWTQHTRHLQERSWERTSSIMALVANVNRGKNSKSYKPADFNPYAKQRAPDLPSTEQLEYLKKWQGNPS